MEFIARFKTSCPSCGAKLNCHAPLVHHDPPSPGDYSLCAYCLTLLVYQDDLSLRTCSNDEIDEIDDDCRAAINKALAVMADGKPTQ